MNQNNFNKSLIFLPALLIALLFSYPLISQPITWQRTYEGPYKIRDVGNDICTTYNGNLYMVGVTYLPGAPIQPRAYVIKLNSYGDTIWTKIVLQAGASAITNTLDGGCVITGSTDQASATKLDSNGNVIWQKFYGGSFVQCYNIIRTSDGGYIASGRDVNIHSDGYILKIDSLGILQWQKVYPALEVKTLNSIIETTNNGYIAAGSTWDMPTGDTAKLLLLRIDTIGNVIWEKKYIIQNRSSGGTTINKIMNGYLIAGGFSGLPLQNFFIKIDTSGNINYTKVFSTSESGYYGDFRIINSNRYVFNTERDSIGTNYMLVNAKILDSLGNILYQRTYAYGRYVEIRKIQTLNNGDIIFAGLVESFQSKSYFYVIRTDSLLNAPPPIGIIKVNQLIPSVYSLVQNYPNPFNPVTTIKFSISKKSFVTIKVFDNIGKEIKMLVNDELNIGNYSTRFEGDGLSSGIYFYSLFIDNKIYQTKKMILIR